MFRTALNGGVDAECHLVALDGFESDGEGLTFNRHHKAVILEGISGLGRIVGAWECWTYARCRRSLPLWLHKDARRILRGQIAENC